MKDLKKIIEIAIDALNEAGETKYALHETTRDGYGVEAFCVEIYSSEFKHPVIVESTLLSEPNFKERAYLFAMKNIAILGIVAANNTYKELSKTNPEQFS